MYEIDISIDNILDGTSPTLKIAKWSSEFRIYGLCIKVQSNGGSK